jgi:murein L,D-transpeptidase YcbB/YkuD
MLRISGWSVGLAAFLIGSAAAVAQTTQATSGGENLPALSLPDKPPALENPAADKAATPPAAAETKPPVDPVAAEVVRRLAALKSSGASKDDEAAIAEFYATRAQPPVWVDAKGLTSRAAKVIDVLRRADDWGLSSGDYPEPAALPAGAGPTTEALAAAELAVSLNVLKYARHARGGRYDPSELSYNIDRAPPLRAPKAVLEAIAAEAAPDAYMYKLHPQHPQFEKLRQLYVAMRAGKVPETVAVAEETSPAAGKGKTKRVAAPATSNLRRVLYNMEMWRWMPEDMGATYVWVNIPEFTLRVSKSGAIIHTERVIVGKPENQTPIFSDEMETIVFQPFWGVPDSIKVKEVLPGLVRGGGMLAKNNLRIQYRGRDIDPYSVDWTRADIRNYHVYQPPGGGNVLGQVKFLFPNKHQVYMHDTPTKHLFAASERTFSHGCMRVRDPMRFAELLLEADKGWSPQRVAATLKNGPPNNNVSLDTHIPVHITYFTVWVGDDGKAQYWRDVYSHEPRIQMGLDGKAHLVAKKKENLAAVRAEVIGRLSEAQATPSMGNWFKQVFGGF